MPAGELTLAARFESEEAMSATAPPVADVTHPLAHEESLVRVYVWEIPVRVTHWMIVLGIAVLSFTGYYLYNPFIISRGSSAFLMGTMRFVHEVTGFVFIAAVLLRFYWFFKGNRWAHWRSFLPLEGWWRRGLRKQLKYYLFFSRDPESEVGHNPLAAATYLVVYALMVVEILTGLALLDYVSGIGHGLLSFCFGWISTLIGVQYVRETHFLIMFAFLAFVIHHVYSAVLIGIEERSGLVGGIFSGYKFFPAAFVASDPTRRPHEERIPAAAAGRSHKRRPVRKHGQDKSGDASPPSASGIESPVRTPK
jgi:Ni/Fe-hydrogenase 1 B-type cytochrome subunit